MPKKQIRVKETRSLAQQGIGATGDIVEARIIDVDEDKLTSMMEVVPETTEIYDWYTIDEVGT